MLPFDKAPDAARALMQRAHALEAAWRTIIRISDPLYDRSEAQDGHKWERAAAVLEAEGVRAPSSAVLDWSGPSPGRRSKTINASAKAVR